MQPAPPSAARGGFRCDIIRTIVSIGFLTMGWRDDVKHSTLDVGTQTAVEIRTGLA